MTEPLGRAGGAAALDGVGAEAWLSKEHKSNVCEISGTVRTTSTGQKSSSFPLPVLDVREAPCGVPGAAEPVAAGPDVAGEEAEDTAPATDTD